MKILKEQYVFISERLGIQKYDEKAKYVKSIYCFEQPVREGVLLYHHLTGEMILMENDEEPYDYLIKQWFFVPIDYDEHSVAQIIKEMLFFNDNDDTLSFCSVLTTTACNARCFYCYQNNLKPKNMNHDQAEKIADYLCEKADKKGIVVDLYGGEPLVNIAAIDTIVERLIEHGVSFSTMMISNGYLFDETLIKKAKQFWRLTRVQITIDGLNEVYSKTKNYINNDRDAFFRVINNIKLLMASKIHAEIRINVDLFNLDEVGYLTNYLINEFKYKPYVNVYLHPLFSNHSCNSITHSDEESKMITEKIIQLENQLYQYGLYECMLRNNPKTNACLADNRKACTIMPDGDIIRCRDYLDAIPSGNAISKVTVPSVVEDWCELAEELEKCKNCKVYPECTRLKMCSEHESCSEASVMYKENGILLSMLETYRLKLGNNEGN